MNGNDAGGWLDRWLDGVPDDGQAHVLGVPVRADDPALAQILATRGRTVVEAARHLDEIRGGQLDESDLYRALDQVGRVARATQAVEEALILAARAAGMSWSTLALALQVPLGTARSRVATIERARAAGREVDVDELDSDPTPPTRTVRVQAGRRVEVVTAGGTVIVGPDGTVTTIGGDGDV